MRIALVSVLLAPLLLCACIPSNVVAPEARRVRTPLDELTFASATSEDLPGFWASERIDGPMAAVLLRVFYLFQADGSFTGAALLDGAPPHFQVLTGTWRFEEGALRLEDAAPARVERAEDHLRLSGPEGSVTLVRDGRP